MTTTRRSALGLLGASGALLATGAVAGAASGPAVGPTSVDVRAFDRFVKEQAAVDAFSGSLLLVHRGRPVLARSYGRANAAAPNGPDTLFAMASVTKLFTAVAIAQLAQAGKLAYTSTLGSLLSGFPAAIADTVQVHHLLTHTSGFGDTFTMPGYLEEALAWTDVDQVMNGTTDYIRRSSPEFTPGAGSRYSNAAYHLLGAIVARVSGKSYYDYVREHVFRPAGMTTTDFCTRPQWHTDPRIAHPYAKQPSGGRADTIDQRLYVGTPAGDAFTTCADLARFAAALQGSTLLDRAFTGITLSGKVPPPPQPGPPPGGTPGAPHVAFQCYGPVTLLVGNQWVTGHGGGAPGTSTDFQMYPDTGWVSVILSNYDYDGGPPPVVKKARDILTA
ncbi:serine hydrolase domain-containing protein [Amycolatopsis sp. NPDC058278]|uniref:serine hydrolase domain-containing protein n=1 Tax=Amycolatopsis sp. NPDC058278 TaxID=3346417 RepID=UPI0036DDC20A